MALMSAVMPAPEEGSKPAMVRITGGVVGIVATLNPKSFQGWNFLSGEAECTRLPRFQRAKICKPQRTRENTRGPRSGTVYFGVTLVLVTVWTVGALTIELTCQAINY